MNNTRLDSPRTIFAWSLYDWANSAFATTIMAGFFPIFFSDYWSVGVDTTVSTFRLGLANSIGSLLVAIMAPILGAIADQGTVKRKFLLFFAFIGILSTCALYWVGQGYYLAAIAFYVFGSIGFAGGNVFYDSLIKGVASSKNMDKVSSYGFSLGYLGGGTLFAINVWMTLQPEVFGLADAAEAVKVSFLTVGVWWAVFSIPLFLFVKEPEMEKNKQQSIGAMIKAGINQVKTTFVEIRRIKMLVIFLLSYFCYMDGVDTIIRMSVDYGRSLNLATADLITALLVVQFVGFPAAIGFGFLGNRIGTKKAILIAIFTYLIITIFAALITNKTEFLMMACAVGLVQGGTQALSRSFYARMIPEGKSAQFFGFYNMIGKSAAILGPILMGGVGILVRSTGVSSEMASRISILSILILFIIGGLLFLKVDEEKAKEQIKAVYG
ncbi:MAG: MFS transporter [Chitinophagales bacterium]